MGIWCLEAVDAAMYPQMSEDCFRGKPVTDSTTEKKMALQYCWSICSSSILSCPSSWTDLYDCLKKNI